MKETEGKTGEEKKDKEGVDKGSKDRDTKPGREEQALVNDKEGSTDPDTKSDGEEQSNPEVNGQVLSPLSCLSLSDDLALQTTVGIHQMQQVTHVTHLTRLNPKKQTVDLVKKESGVTLAGQAQVASQLA